MGELRFAEPLWLLGLAFLPWLLVHHVRHRRSLEGSVQFSSLVALRQVPPSPWTRVRQVLSVGKVLGLACLVAAMARPQSGARIVDVSAEGVDIMLVLDVSSSMQVKDLGPASRLDVAKEVVSRFIAGRRTDRIGMVVFAAESFTQCPLTLDYRVLLDFLGEVRMAEESWDGTAIGMALVNACNRLRDAAKAHGGKSQVAILLTDGVNNAGEIDPATAAQVAAAVGVRVYTIGVGAEGRGPRQGMRRPQGLDFDEQTLRDIALATGGRYYHANSSEKLAQIYDEIGRLETVEVTSQVHLEYTERYVAFLWPGLFLLLADFLLSHTRFRRVP